jgi:uncharacterized 2Fe-2S/4Fe-4S cluster protein (DUF4445 family)
LSEENKAVSGADGRVVRRRGLRCQVCTGCGLCPGVTGDSAANRPGKLHVLAEDALQGEALPITDWRVEDFCGHAAAGNGSERNSPCGHTAAGNGSERNSLYRRLAVADVGTTTIAMLLFDRDGTVSDRVVALNPQAVYGADVLSRISAAADANQARDMRRQVTGVLEQGLSRFRRRILDGESLTLAAAANTTMKYLLTGRDTSELGCAPFRAAYLWETDVEIAGTPAFLFPGLSAFVGGDITAGMLACGMDKREEITLLVDLGTNGEIVLGNRKGRIACATAAGPAFEGGANRGIWGADMIRLLAVLRREGLLDETGLLAKRYFKTGIRVGNVCVTQQAVRAVQLAKAAIAAGIETLLKKYGIVSGQVERVVLAGGFGYYLQPEAAAQIGLLPGALAKKAVAGGNTALSGGLLAGREILGAEQGRQRLLERLHSLAEGTECVNLAEEPEFGMRYVERMNLVTE